MKIFAFILLLIILTHKKSTITTIAGGGIEIYSNKNGPATSVSLLGPSQVTIDKGGNIYVAECRNHVIKKINRDGVISLVAGNYHGGFTGDGSIAINTSLFLPADIAIDKMGNIYIADMGNNRIRKISIFGIIYTIAGNGQSYSTGDGDRAALSTLNRPAAIIVDRKDNLLIVELGGNCVRKIDPNGIITTIAGNGEASFSGDNDLALNATLNLPTDIAVDSKNNIYITDLANNRIRKISAAGIISTFAGTGVQGYDKDGTQATACRLNHPYGIFIDSKDNVYFSDNNNVLIRKIDTKNIITTIAGTPGKAGYSGDGEDALKCQINDPGGIAIDDSGNLLIADFGNNVIRKITK